MQEEMLKLDTVIVPLFKDPHIVDITFPYTKDFKKELHIPKRTLYIKVSHVQELLIYVPANGWIGSLCCMEGQSSDGKDCLYGYTKSDPSCGLPLTSETTSFLDRSFEIKCFQ